MVERPDSTRVGRKTAVLSIAEADVRTRRVRAESRPLKSFSRDWVLSETGHCICKCSRPTWAGKQTSTDKASFASPLYSITSSARASSVGGISTPSARAVLRLMTNSNLVGCSIGKSAGFAPRAIRSTMSAAWLHTLSKFGP